jgi:hypothetical protein
VVEHSPLVIFAERGGPPPLADIRGPVAVTVSVVRARLIAITRSLSACVPRLALTSGGFLSCCGPPSKLDLLI